MTTMRIMFATWMMAMALLPAKAQSGTKMEAEDATNVNCELITDSKYSCGKALSLTKENAKITFTYNCSEKGKYTIYVMGEGIGGEKEVALTVNNAKATFKVNTLTEVEAGTFKLPAGSNTIVITPSWTWFNIDYIRIEKATNTITFDIAAAPVDAKATESAKKLYSFLKENFGKTSISGMMTGDMTSANGKVKEHADIVEFYNRSGKYPALIGFDFMNTTGKDAAQTYNKDYSDKSVALAKDTWKQGGIPALTWHWRDPSRATNEFYTEKTTVKIANAMNSDGSWNTSSQLYKNMIQDIDAIADIFLDMQDAGIACIFRPLHESSGGWFWWGANGADNFKKLYQLVYDRMVNTKGVHNVIWVWNAGGNDQDWDPGQTYYDVVSADLYNQAYDYSSNFVLFDKLKALTGGKKIVAFSENGPIPDISLMFEDEAEWSWWMPWYQTWNGKFLDQTSSEQLTKMMKDSRSVSLSDMPGWDNYSGIKKVVTATRKPTEGFYNLKGQKLKKKPSSGLFISGGMVFFAK